MQLKDTMLFRQHAFINGEWLDADNGQTINVTNLANADVMGTVPKKGAAETWRAIQATTCGNVLDIRSFWYGRVFS